MSIALGIAATAVVAGGTAEIMRLRAELDRTQDTYRADLAAVNTDLESMSAGPDLTPQVRDLAARLSAIESRMSPSFADLATTDDLNGYATHADLAQHATQTDLSLLRMDVDRIDADLKQVCDLLEGSPVDSFYYNIC